MPNVYFDKWEDLQAHLKKNGVVVAVHEPDRLRPNRSLVRASLDPEIGYRLEHARAVDNDLGYRFTLSDIYVSKELLALLNGQAGDENSSFRRMSTRSITRTFVYLDISDFSKMRTGLQLLVVHALVRLAAGVQEDIHRAAEAQLCIGDGYIYVWESATDALRFAGTLARSIEEAVAEKHAPEFHFRIGAHIGSVRCFWDPGRKDWNYVGDGINGGNRVLSAIGKETDDVVFVSGQLRSEIQKSPFATSILPHLHNRGRKQDKHGNPWRVYEYNHSAVSSF